MIEQSQQKKASLSQWTWNLIFHEFLNITITAITIYYYCCCCIFFLWRFVVLRNLINVFVVDIFIYGKHRNVLYILDDGEKCNIYVYSAYTFVLDSDLDTIEQYFLFPYRIFSLCILYVAELVVVVVVIPLAFLCRLPIFFIRHHRIMRTMRCDVSLFRTTDQPFKDDAHAFTQIILHLFLINIYRIIAIFYYIFFAPFYQVKTTDIGRKEWILSICHNRVILGDSRANLSYLAFTNNGGDL